MAKIKFAGMDKYVAQLERLNAHAEGDIKRAVYEGAAVVAHDIAAGLRTLRTSEDGLTEEEKEGLIAGFGLAPMRKENSYINTKAGFSGRSPKKTKRYPNGVPNTLIARQIESGTSWIQKQPVIRQATTRSKPRAEAAMAEEIARAIRQHQSGG